MEGLNRNGSYVQRRKMYIQFPLHNMKSKIPIDWSIDNRATQEKNRIVSKQISEKEYIRREYDQKMDRKIKERYNSGLGNYKPMDHESLIHNGRDVLTKELEQFNTKAVNATITRHNPQFAEPQSPKSSKDIQAESSQSESRYRQEDRYRAERENYENQEPFTRDQRYSEKERNQSLENDRQRSYNQRSQDGRYYYDRDQRINDNVIYSPQSQNYLQNKSIPLPYSQSPRNYKDPYLLQKQHNYDLVKQYRKYAQKQPQSSQDHPFRNVLPDRLEQFLRQKTKSDRKSVIKVTLKNKQ